MLRVGDVITPDWPCPANVRALITTRAGGVSAPPFDSFNLGRHPPEEIANAEENRRRLAAFTGARSAWLAQVHGARVVRAEEALQSAAPLQADASVATSANIAATVMVADCLPVLFCDRGGRAVAAAHAGWRGLSGGVLETTVAAMPAKPADIMAYLGPAIGPARFQVGDDVRDAFVSHAATDTRAFSRNPKAPDTWLCDLYQLARLRLTRVGVTQIYGGGYCTVSEPARFFSYRRDHTTGRMAALVWLTS